MVVEQHTVGALFMGELQSLVTGFGFGKHEVVIRVASKHAAARHAVYRIVLD